MRACSPENMTETVGAESVSFALYDTKNKRGPHFFCLKSDDNDQVVDGNTDVFDQKKVHLFNKITIVA